MVSSPFSFHQTARPTGVTLSVTNLDRSLGFYENVLGLQCVDRASDMALLGNPNHAMIELQARPKAVRRKGMAGLFHFALLLPDRRSLGAALDRLIRNGISLTGAADHHASEAIYLDDPDGHGIELYRDRPTEDWYRNGELVLNNHPLDLAKLRSIADPGHATSLPATTILGHIHLETLDLDDATEFYKKRLSMSLMASRPQASFLGWNGYHHHLAVNCWNRKSEPSDRGDSIGLVSVELTCNGQRTAERIFDNSGVEIRLQPSHDLAR